MKGGDGGGVGPAKPLWRGLAIGVLFLMILSMLIHLGFLLGLHNGFHSSGFVPLQHSSPSGDRTRHVDNLERKLGPTLPKDIIERFVHEVRNETSSTNATRKSQQMKGFAIPPQVVLQPLGNGNISRDIFKTGMKRGVDENL